MPVPELIPFRMTPLFTSVMAPIVTSHVMEQHMAACLSALRMRSRDILNVMEVFVHVSDCCTQ